jgi:hypothetical protein
MMAIYISDTVIFHNGKYIPVDTENSDYNDLILTGIAIDPKLPQIPTSVPKLALVRALRMVGLDGDPENPNKAWTAVRQMIENGPADVKEDWDLSNTIPRNYPDLIAMANLVIPPENVDAILNAVFLLAKEIDSNG